MAQGNCIEIDPEGIFASPKGTSVELDTPQNQLLNSPRNFLEDFGVPAEPQNGAQMRPMGEKALLETLPAAIFHDFGRCRWSESLFASILVRFLLKSDWSVLGFSR